MELLSEPDVLLAIVFAVAAVAFLILVKITY